MPFINGKHIKLLVDVDSFITHSGTINCVLIAQHDNKSCTIPYSGTVPLLSALSDTLTDFIDNKPNYVEFTERRGLKYKSIQSEQLYKQLRLQSNRVASLLQE